MFGFGKSKSALAKKIGEIAIDASNQFLEYLKEDVQLYTKCINQNPIKNTSAIFIINIYRDILNSKYNSDDVFVVMRTTIMTLAPNKSAEDMLMQSFFAYMKACNQAVDYYK